MGRLGRLWRFIIERPFIIFLALGLITFLTNYTLGTHLLGWDTLAPELNPLLNLKRAISSVWQDYRGLGTYDGLAHGATLSHVIITWLLTLIMPDSLVRYAVTFSLWTLGGYFMYRLCDSLKLKKPIAIIAGIWYMTNIGTIQQFIAPLEVFTYHHLALPLLAFTGLLFIRNSSKRNLVYFTLAAAITLASGFVPTLFLIQSLALVLFWIAVSLTKKNRTALIILCLVYGAIHSAWALPFFTNISHKGPVIQQARINEFSSDELYTRNMARGSAISVLKLEGYMLDSIEYDARLQQNITLMQAWRSIRGNIVGQILLFSTIGIMLIGLFHSLRNKKTRPVGVALLVTFLLTGILLANNSLLGKPLISLIRHILPFFAEAYRIPFTKCITAFVFAYTIFFAYGLTQLTGLLQERKYISKALLIGTLLSIAFLFSPAFGGNFVSPAVRVKLPDGYKKVMAYFRAQPADGRIMTLPAHTYWNWEFRSWGYRGSGFLWYGVPQALMLRAFDPWSGENEQFYNEASYAIRTENTSSFEALLTRYDISYLLIDESTINVLSEKNISVERLYRFLETIPGYTRVFEATPLVVYQKTSTADWPNGLDNPAKVTLGEHLYYRAPALLSGSIQTGDHGVIYPFPGLYSEKKNIAWTANIAEKILTFSQEFNPPLTAGYTINLPSIPEDVAFARFIPSGKELLMERVPLQLGVNGKKIPNAEPTTIIVSSDFQPNYSIALDGLPLLLNTTYALTEKEYVLHIMDSHGDEVNWVQIYPHDGDHTVNYTLEAPTKTLSLTIPLGDNLLFDKDILRSKPDQKISSDTKSLISPCNKRIAKATETNEGLQLEARCGSVDIAWYLDPLFHSHSYVALLGLRKTKEGLPVTFYVDNSFEKRAEVDVRLHETGTHVITIPPTQDFFQGYGFHIVSKSFNNERSSATIEKLDLHALPYRTITGLTLTKGIEQGGPLALTRPEKLDSWLYKTHPIIHGRDTYITLSQSFDPGWQAFVFDNENQFQLLFPFLGTGLTDHVKAQGWANAWRLPDTKNLEKATIVMVFIPQYLQYVGYIIWAALVIFVVQYKKKSS